MNLPRTRPVIRKRFGQHFLHDRAVVAKILAAINPQPGQALVEIGPGQGVLTGPLLAAAGALDAIEIDRDLAAALSSRYAAQPGFRLHTGDALRFDWAALAAARGLPLRVVGNVPYNISTPLLFRLLAQRRSLLDLTFMLQREVVARIVATPGSEHYGRLGIMLAPFAAAELLLEVGPGAFSPPPKVWSAVVRLQLVREPQPWALLPEYGELVRLAFNQRRKTLRNSLHSRLTPGEIAAAGIDPLARPETLTPAEFGALATAARAKMTA